MGILRWAGVLYLQYSIGILRYVIQAGLDKTGK